MAERSTGETGVMRLSGPSSIASLKEILNLDKAELVFQRLLEAVEAHSSELAAVKREVSTKAGGDELRGMCREINGRLAALEHRVAAAESAVTIPENSDGGGGPGGVPGGIPRGGRGRGLGDTTRGFTVGEAVQANGQALRVAMARLEEKAGKDELTAKGEELEASLRERERALRQWGVGRDFADSLGRAHRGLASQLVAVKGVLTTKLDKLELDNMQAACAKVSTVSEFLDEAAERVSTLEAGLGKEERERRERGRETGEALRCLRADLAKKSDAHDARLVAQDLVDLRESFVGETKSGAKQLRALRQGAEEIKKNLGKFSGSTDGRLLEVEACLLGAATKEEVALKADANRVEGELRGLRADVALRAHQSSLSSLETTVSSLGREHDKTRKASDLSARFVDWFSSRGQAYEHNLAAVETHIENLATRSVGARASPALATAAATARVARGSSNSGGYGYGGGGGSHSRGGVGGRFSSAPGGVSMGGGVGTGVPYGGGVRFTPA